MIGKVLILGIVLISTGATLIFVGIQECQGMTGTPSSGFQCPAGDFGLSVSVLLTLGLTCTAIAVTEQRANRLKTQPGKASSS